MRFRFRVNVPLVGNGLASVKKSVPDLPNYSARLHGGTSPLAHVLRGTYTEADFRKHMAQVERKTRPMVVFRPGRTLPAPWLDEALCKRESIALCDDCLRKYGYKGWCKEHSFKPLWHPKQLTDCDACSGTLLYCTGFWPLEHPTPWATVCGTRVGNAKDW